ncbi:unnamed protein product [Prunus armeniaca]
MSQFGGGGTGATYLFDMYTRELKVSLKVDQSDVLKTYKRLGTNLGSFCRPNCGGNPILKGLIGLNGAIITQLALAFCGDQSVRHILLLIAWFPAAIAMAFSFTVRPMDVSHDCNTERFFTFPRIGYVGSRVVILFLLALPLLIAIQEERFILSLKQQPDNHPVAINTGSTTEGAVVLPDAGQSQQDILMQKIGLAKGASCLSTSNIVNKPRRGEDHTILQAIFSVDMLLIFIISLTGFGSSTTAIGNLSEIAVSNDLQFNTMGNIELLKNIWNYFGRVYCLGTPT